MRLLQFGDRITLARILSSPPNQFGSRHHGLLLTLEDGEIFAVKVGFASGYGGEGPHGLSFILELLQLHKIKIEEYDVDEEILERMDLPSLTSGDLDKIEEARRVLPTRWYDYILDLEEKHARDGKLWLSFPPVIPFAIIDSRITDLALNFFENPDKNLLDGYRRLEDIIRNRTGINEHGHGLFAKAFHGEKAKLYWKELNDAEQIGRANLFTGTYMAYRNPRAHRELSHGIHSQLMEFLLLNHLFVLEKDSIERPEDNSKQAKVGQKHKS